MLNRALFATLSATVVAFFPFTVFASGSLSFTPASGSYNVGDEVALHVMLDSTEALSGTEGKVTFDAKAWQIDVESVADVSGWVEKPTLKDGVVEFSALLASSSPRKSELFTLHAKALRVGSQLFHFDSAATIAADGTGGNVLGTIGEAKFDVTPKEGGPSEIAQSVDGQVLGISTDDSLVTVTSPDIVDPSKWYAFASTSVHILVSRDIERMHIGITKKSSDAGYRAIDVAATGTATTTELVRPIEKLDEGEWWYHVTPDMPDATTTHFRLAIDRTAPILGDTKIRESADASDPHVVILFNATDTLSGIASVTAGWDGVAGSLVTPEGGLINLIAPDTGSHKVKLVVSDYAGNHSEMELSVKVDPITSPIVSLKGMAREAEPLVFNVKGKPGKVDIDFFGSGVEHKDTIILDGAGNGEWVLKEQLNPGPYEIDVIQTMQNGAKSLAAKLDVTVTATALGYLGRNLAVSLALLAVLVVVMGAGGYVFLLRTRSVADAAPLGGQLALPAPRMNAERTQAIASRPQVIAPVAIQRASRASSGPMLQGDIVDLRRRN